MQPPPSLVPALSEELAALDGASEDPAPAAAARRGREARRTTPRRALAELAPSSRSAVEILVEQNAGRVPSLVGLRFARMLADPFAFYRGSAAVMAADLAQGPTPAIDVVASGDAHLANFGVYAAPHRALVFDLNDFDEAAWAPAEWDLKRLATSVVVGGAQARYRRRTVDAAVRHALEAYRTALGRLLALTPLERYYLSAQAETADVPSDLRAVVGRTLRQARSRTSAQAFAKIMAPGADGVLRLREAPPVVVHLQAPEASALQALVRTYLATLPVDVALLVSQHRLVDLARRVVGVGSVGTRCYLLVLVGPDGSPLLLQVKQASASVLQTYGKQPQPAALTGLVGRHGEGARVVTGQRVMQAASDVFLGSVRHAGVDYYVRQFRDMKGSVDLTRLSPSEFVAYGGVCARLLARAHAQSPGAAAFAGYLGRGDAALEAIGGYARAYAAKSLDDFHELRAAARAGHVPVDGESAGPPR